MAEDRMLSDEVLLALIKKNSGGGGGGGTDNYNDLKNKPQIAGTVLTGNKSLADLGIASATALGTVSDAVTAITDGQTIDSFSDVETALEDKVDVVSGKGLSTNDYTDADKAIVGGVTAALAGKQDALTAGKYIDIDANNEISVEREIPNEAFTYTIKQIDDYSLEIIKTVNDAVVFDEVYSCYDPVAQQQIDVNETFDDAINIHIYPAGERSYTLLIASDAHEAGFKQTTPWWQRNTFVENFSTVDHSGEKLIIKSELDAEVNAIKDGQSIDSFADVETALAGKQDALTFDDVPTDNSNNPVKSNGIYDALAGKQDIFERISYANWQLLSPQQQAAKPYYIYDYPNSGTVQAANVAYSNTSSGLSATTAQGGIDELASEKQDKTDNNLTTTNKTVVGGINELKSGLNDVNSKLINTAGVINLEASGNVSSIGGYADRNGQICTLNLALVMTAQETTGWITLGTVPPPIHVIRTDVVSDSAASVGTLRVQIEGDGTFKVFYGGAGEYRIVLTYIITTSI